MGRGEGKEGGDPEAERGREGRGERGSQALAGKSRVTVERSTGVQLNF